MTIEADHGGDGEHFVVSLPAVLQALGMKVSWQGDSTIEIYSNRLNIVVYTSMYMHEPEILIGGRGSEHKYSLVLDVRLPKGSALGSRQRDFLKKVPLETPKTFENWF